MGYEDQMRQIARQMIAQHGNLVEVNCISGLRPVNIELKFAYGYKEIISKHSGQVDISMMKFGYHGTGTRCFHAFLDEAGYKVTFEDLVNLENGTVLKPQRDQ